MKKPEATLDLRKRMLKIEGYIIAIADEEVDIDE
jgi:hypothetical protein